MSYNKGTDEIFFSIEEIPKHRKAKVWKDTLNEFFYDYEAKLNSDFMIGKLRGCHVGDLSIASVESDAMAVWRTERQIARDGIDAYFVLLPAGTHITFAQRGREATIGINQYSIVSTSQSYKYLQNETTTYNNLIVPGKSLRQLIPNADDLVATLNSETYLNRMFTEYSTSFCSNLDSVDSRAQKILSNHMVELLGLALDGADAMSSAAPVKLAHRRRIINLIEHNFRNPAFDINYISRHLQISTRYIHNIFDGDEETLSAIIRKRRIEEAYRLLQARKSKNSLIKQIALEVGFVSQSHFGRVFKREIGLPQTKYRCR